MNCFNCDEFIAEGESVSIAGTWKIPQVVWINVAHALICPTCFSTMKKLNPTHFDKNGNLLKEYNPKQEINKRALGLLEDLDSDITEFISQLPEIVDIDARSIYQTIKLLKQSLEINPNTMNEGEE